MATIISADFNIEDFDLTTATVAPVTDVYGTTWSLTNASTTGVTSHGSSLQEPPLLDENYYDDTALKGDSYVTIPQTEVIVTDAFFEAKPVDYPVNLTTGNRSATVNLRWSIGEALQADYGGDPVPTEVVIRWDTLGEPQTVGNGSFVARITASNQISEMDHTNLPLGTWIYYSIFVRYSSTAYRHWYEKVGSVHVQTPDYYESTEMLWKRIPQHYRIQDGFDGPLHRMLAVFGWDIDRIRTLAHHQMVTRDPLIATTEALDELARELGIQMSSEDLGTERLRNYLNDIGYFRAKKGTLEGVRETLTAITGSDVVIRPLTSSILTSAQSTFSGTKTVTTNDSLVPTSAGWIFYTTAASAGLGASAGLNGGVDVYTSASAGYNFVAVKTKVEDVGQASMYRAFYSATAATNASVVGMSFSPTTISSASVSVDQTTHMFGGLSADPKYTMTSGVDVYYVPVELGIPGDGTLTKDDMYLYIFLVVGPNSKINLNNVRVVPDDRYPYSIDIYSQRVNLCKDPKFVYGVKSQSTFALWAYDLMAGDVSCTTSSGQLVFQNTSPTTAASVTVSCWESFPMEVGIPYYFSIDDEFDSVDMVLCSHLYNQDFAFYTVEPVYEVKYTEVNKRKTWKLLIEYADPWLPKNIDATLWFNVKIPANSSAVLSRPLLEPLNTSGTYFDGDNVNGGWLVGPNAGGGVADYRWGDAGPNVSFSYYTSDYQRTVATVLRLLDTIIPVTQTDEPSNLVKFDCIYGYTGAGRP